MATLTTPTNEELQTKVTELETKLANKKSLNKAEESFLASCKEKALASMGWTMRTAAEHPILATLIVFSSGLALGAYIGYSSGIHNAKIQEAFQKAGFAPME